MGSNQKLLLILGMVLMILGAFMNLTTRETQSNASRSRNISESSLNSSSSGSWGDSGSTARRSDQSTKSYFGS